MTENSWESSEEAPGRVRVVVEGYPHPFYIDSTGLSDKEVTMRIMLVVETHLAQRFYKKTVSKLHHAEQAVRALDEQATPPTVAPPALAEAFISIFMPRRFSEAQLGDMQEIFEANAIRHGLSRAKRLYWYEVARSVGPIMFHWLKRVGFIALLVATAGRKWVCDPSLRLVAFRRECLRLSLIVQSHPEQPHWASVRLSPSEQH